MTRPSLVLLLAGMAACVHTPPDKGVRRVVRAAPVRRTPRPVELRGSWRSRELRGALAELGHSAVYVFRADGGYTGALVSETSCTPVEGKYTYRKGLLDLDGGALRFKVNRVDQELELVSPDSYVRLVPLGPR